MQETALFAISGEFFTEPYLTCIRDISEGMPIRIALESCGLDAAHEWKVDPLDFYLQARDARKFAIKQALFQLDKLAASGEESKYLTAPARIMMWKSEQLMKDGKYLSDIIERLQALQLENKQRNAEADILTGVGYSDGINSESYYAKYSAH